MKFQTMRTQDLIEVSLESRECLDMLFDLMKNTELEDYDTYSFYTMCELVWLNSQILFLLRRDLDEISFKDDTQEEVATETAPQTKKKTLKKAAATEK